MRYIRNLIETLVKRWPRACRGCSRWGTSWRHLSHVTLSSWKLRCKVDVTERVQGTCSPPMRMIIFQSSPPTDCKRWPYHPQYLFCFMLTTPPPLLPFTLPSTLPSPLVYVRKERPMARQTWYLICVQKYSFNFMCGRLRGGELPTTTTFGDKCHDYLIHLKIQAIWSMLNDLDSFFYWDHASIVKYVKPISSKPNCYYLYQIGICVTSYTKWFTTLTCGSKLLR